MTTLLQRVSSAMQQYAPLCLADRSWDNVGVLVENPRPKGSGVVLLTIDLTREVLQECIRRNVEVVVAYHPVIFSAMKSLTLPRQEILLIAVAAGVSVYSPHTSLDAVEGGINDWLASLVDPNGKLAPIEKIRGLTEKDKQHPRVTDACGVGRVLTLSASLSIEDVVGRVKAGLQLEHVRVALPSSWSSDRHHQVKAIAICAGSGSSVFRSLPPDEPVDVLFTGEMGHHDVLAATAAGKAVILCEHTNTERGYLRAALEPALQKALGSEVQVLTSQVDEDPLKLW
eukprot:gene4886-3505_t